MKSRFLKKLAMLSSLLGMTLLLTGCPFYSSSSTVYPNTLLIENHSSSFDDIWYAYLTPSDALTWGDDLLGVDILQPGEYITIDVYDCNNYYDIRVEYEGGLIVEEYDIWLPCNTTTIVPFTDY